MQKKASSQAQNEYFSLKYQIIGNSLFLIPQLTITVT